MNIVFNGKNKEFNGKSLDELTTKDVRIVNGYMVEKNVELHEGDIVVAIDKGKMPSFNELHYMMEARNTPMVNDKIHEATVGIAGLGGIGSHVAEALARLGVGTLVIADYDVVEPSNLNRQCYMIGDLGKTKSAAMKDIITAINPYIKVRSHNIKVTEKNASKIFEKCSIVVEAFDKPENKAMLVNALLENTSATIVACSGMAGYGSGNDIAMERKMKRLYIAGDGESEAREFNGLMAPRVMISAGQQANMVLRLLLGIEEV